jgi:hypothetical protein
MIANLYWVALGIIHVLVLIQCAEACSQPNSARGNPPCVLASVLIVSFMKLCRTAPFSTRQTHGSPAILAALSPTPREGSENGPRELRQPHQRAANGPFCVVQAPRNSRPVEAAPDAPDLPLMPS